MTKLVKYVININRERASCCSILSFKIYIRKYMTVYHYLIKFENRFILKLIKI